MATHPYRGLPPHQFWSTGIAEVPAEMLDPVVTAKFTVGPQDVVAAAGSCFAQHIARHLKSAGYNFLQQEAPLSETEPVFSARYGNIYTTRQLRQLLANAYGLHRPATRVWRRPDGRYIDPLRPQMFPEGFDSADDVLAARRAHVQAVRAVFETCNVFVFTLGLTEAWLAADGSALPVPPGALGVAVPGDEAAFQNFTVAEMRADLEHFLTDFADLNPEAKVILTVSPVPLVATYESRHVLVSNSYSKAALRVVAEETAAAHSNVAYFPSYEIITAPQVRGAYFEPDLRNVTPQGVAHVMDVFATHIMSTETTRATPAPVAAAPVEITAEARARYAALGDIICDEELLDAGGTE